VCSSDLTMITQSLISALHIIIALTLCAVALFVTKISAIFVAAAIILHLIFYREIFVLIDMFDFQTLLFIVRVVALLHDVADHKYVKIDPSLKEKFNVYIQKFTTRKRTVKGTIYCHLFTAEMISAIIDRISFSRQKEKGTSDWIPTLGYLGYLVRNIVSDADKLEAIGAAGIDRCVSYTIEIYEHKNIPAFAKNVHKDVETHYNEKLKIISSCEYMKTPFGWLYAKLMDREMRLRLEKLSKHWVSFPNDVLNDGWCTLMTY
jgi:uncharacterized protein